MEVSYLFCLIKYTFEYVYTLEEYRGAEEKILSITCGGKEVTSICPIRLKMFTQLQFLYIVNTSLESIPDGIEYLINLRIFEYFGNNGIGKDSDIAKLGKLKNLGSINLSNNKIKEIPNCFKSCDDITTNDLNCNNFNFSNLKKLIFRGNQIQDFPIEFFSLTSLEKLDISKNNIVSIPAEIGFLSSLKELICKENNIQTIPNEIGNLAILEVFDASATAIVELPNSFYKLKNLTKLILSKNNFKVLSPLFAQQTNLKVLDISYNTIRCIPSEMKYLLNLMCLIASNNKSLSFIDGNNLPNNICVLDISNNNLIDIPKLSHLENLMELNISYNNMSILSSEITLTKNLAILNASVNCFQSLPKNFGNLNMLKYLLLNNNILSSLPSSFSKLDISFLNLSNNLFTGIPFEVSQLKSLNTLMLKNNLISRLLDSNYSTDNNTPETFNLESNAHEQHIGLFKRLEYAYFDNNKIKNVTSEIKLLKNLCVLSFANNKIKSVSEALGELKCLKTLNLQNNKLRYLPFCMKQLKAYVLTTIHLQENFILYNNSELGLGISGLTTLKFIDLQVHSQYLNYIKIEKVVQNLQSQDIYWNIDELKRINLPVDIAQYSSLISDKQLRKMWRVVLQYFIPYQRKRIEPDSESSEEIMPVIEDNITKIVSTAAFIALKNKDNLVDNYTPAYNKFCISRSLRKRVSNFLREISILNVDAEPNQHNDLAKNYIKALFYKLIEIVVDCDFDLEQVEQIKVALSDLCENRLFECISGRLEGLQYYFSIYFANGNGSAYSSIVEYIKNIIASIKETTFVKVTNGDNIHGVHNICKWKAIFKEFLGITHSFKDPYDSQYLPINSKYKIGSVLNEFFNQFEINQICGEILDKININRSKVTESVDFLTHICKSPLEQEDIYISYMNTIKKYYEYDTLKDYNELLPKQLKKEGLIKILIHLQILKKKEIIKRFN